MIDLHCHILPGLDDGAAGLEDSVELARAFVSLGILVVAATPHVRDDFPTTPEQLRAGLATLGRELSRRSIPLQVLSGAEISLDVLDRLTPAELRAFGLAANPAYVLLEFPYAGWPLTLSGQAAGLLELGVTPVLAHPERNPDVQADPLRLGELVQAGVLVQVTAASITGLFGRPTRSTALRLVRSGLAHLVSSDAHTSGKRLAALAEVHGAVGDRRLTRWLTRDAPLAILNGGPWPDRPRASRSRWQRLRRGPPL